MAQKQFEVVVTAPFVEDLLLAKNHLYEEVGPMSSRRLTDEFEIVVSNLKVLPSAGIRIKGTDYLWSPLGAFVAVYSIREKESVVYLERLFYISSDWKDKILGGQGISDITYGIQDVN